MSLVMMRCAGLGLSLCCAFLHAPTPVSAATDSGSEAAPDSSERRIDILKFRIDGNTVLDRIEVERAVMPYLGPQRPLEDVEAARAALEQLYRDHGYETVGVEIPEQEVQEGVIRLRVVELGIGRLRVVNSRYFSPEDIKERMPSLEEGEVPNYRDVSRELAAVNKSADRIITPTLQAGDTPGTVDVDLEVEDQLPLHGSLELNDRSSSRTKRLRTAASLRYTNLFQLEHSLSLQGQFTPQAPEQSWVVSGSYAAPIQGTPFSVVAYGVHSNSDVAAIGGIGVLGTGNIVGLRGIYSITTGDPLQPTLHQITAGIDYKNFEENLVLGADTASTPIDYVPLTLQYQMAQRADSHEFDVGFGVNVGLRGLDAKDMEFRLKRFNASASWIAFQANLAYLHKFAGDWRVGIRLSGQLAGQSLISNEQFSAGGLESVRGYYESQVLGDDGASGQFQIDSPSLHGIADWINEFRLFVFADGAVLHVRNPLGDQAAYTELLSVGGGFTFRILERLSASTLLAAPLENKGGALIDFGDDFRVQFRVLTEF